MSQWEKTIVETDACASYGDNAYSALHVLLVVSAAEGKVGQRVSC